MKKSTIWIIAVVMGICFLALILLEAGYIDDNVKMRRRQFDTSVGRALYVAVRNVELDETQRGLELGLAAAPGDTLELRRGALADSLQKLPDAWGTQRRSGSFKEGEMETTESPQGVRGMRRRLSRAYKDEYRRDMLDEVVFDILYKASELPLKQRLDFNKLDLYVKNALKNEGLNLKYHIRVETSDGEELYRCQDYDERGAANSYTATLFPNDKQTLTGNVIVHFPDMQQYIFASVRFIIPAIIFTFILLVIFCFTVYAIFRQKRMTEIRNDFINNMTHEFKTPISTISLASQMLSDPGVTKSPAMLSHLSGIINDETKRLRFQVEKILQISMFNRRGGAYKNKEFDMAHVVEDVVGTFRLKVESAGGTIVCQVNAPKSKVYGDEIHLTNVVFNLLDNAVKYKSEERRLELNVKVTN
ncbi:MAG: HAMP domain-containing histidine kinase, partial [Bacteroidaceae bacterium]|nr:HAMP domain-containing histidine kinase [Bacteroidaceae bacterium]